MPRYERVCCSVLQCVVMCCSVLQCVAACCSVLQYVTVCCSVLLMMAGVDVHAEVCQSVLQARCSVWQCIAV